MVQTSKAGSSSRHRDVPDSPGSPPQDRAGVPSLQSGHCMEKPLPEPGGGQALPASKTTWPSLGLVASGGGGRPGQKSHTGPAIEGL